MSVGPFYVQGNRKLADCEVAAIIARAGISCYTCSSYNDATATCE